jgi:hypothetical protein
VVAVSDYVMIEPDVQRAIERWENEGGWSTTAARERARAVERGGTRERFERPDSHARTALVVHRLPIQRAGGL